MSALERARRLQRLAATEGFDWDRPEPIWDKLAEEMDELRAACAESPARQLDELGDLLFVVVNLARHLGLDPEMALRQANAKFERRYAFVMQEAAALPPLGDPRRLEAMEERWVQAKKRGL